MQPLKHQNARSKLDQIISQSFRVQWIVEDPKKTKAENLFPKIQRVNDVLNFIGDKPNTVERKRLGKFDAERVETRSLLVTSSSEVEARLVLAERKEKRKTLSELGCISLQRHRKMMPSKKNLIFRKRNDLLNRRGA